MKNITDLIWETALHLGLKCQGSDALEILKALEREGYISEKGMKSKLKDK